MAAALCASSLLPQPSLLANQPVPDGHPQNHHPHQQRSAEAEHVEGIHLSIRARHPAARSASLLPAGDANFLSGVDLVRGSGGERGALAGDASQAMRINWRGVRRAGVMEIWGPGRRMRGTPWTTFGLGLGEVSTFTPEKFPIVTGGRKTKAPARFLVQRGWGWSLAQSHTQCWCCATPGKQNRLRPGSPATKQTSGSAR